MGFLNWVREAEMRWQAVYRYTAKAGHFPRYYDSGLFSYLRR